MTDECVDEIIQLLDDLPEEFVTKPDPRTAG